MRDNTTERIERLFTNNEITKIFKTISFERYCFS